MRKMVRTIALRIRTVEPLEEGYIQKLLLEILNVDTTAILVSEKKFAFRSVRRLLTIENFELFLEEVFGCEYIKHWKNNLKNPVSFKFLRQSFLKIR